MPDCPRVSIVTPSFNQARYLREAIESVLSQDYGNIEYIVIDGGSTDGSVDVIRQYADRIAYWTSTSDGGQADAVNKGFQRATGEIVAFLNSDDFYYPGTLRRVVEAFLAHPNAGIVHGRGQFVAENGRPLRSVGEAIDPRRMIDGLFPALPQPAVFIRRRVLDTVGGLDTSLHYALDGEFFWRAFANFDAVFIPHTLAALRLQQESKSVAAGSRFAPEILRIAEKVIADPAAYPRFRVNPRDVRAAALLNSARFLYNNGLYRDALGRLGKSLRLSRRYAAAIALHELPRLILHMIFGASRYDATGRMLLHRMRMRRGERLNDRSFEIHVVEWDRDKSARFWNYIASRPAFQQLYFSRLVGRSVVAMARRMGVRLSGRVLDFGCGPGYLLDNLLARGVACEGADFSARSVAMVNERLKDAPLFRGVTQLQGLPSSLPSDAYDVVFFIETIEHLLDADLDATVAELRRILKPGGAIILTTPNDEDLDVNESLCPDCGCSFHRIQHVRSWSAQSLTQFMTAHGFRRAKSRTTFFRPTASGTMLFEIITRLRRRKLPNLIWVGNKA